MPVKQEYPRSSGVLMPVTMLHGPFGVGVLGREAIEFIDFLSESGFHAWQVLPIENTGASYSPYKCVSACAGEPMLIDPRELFEMGLITGEELDERASGTNEDFVDYELVYEKQWRLLKTAFSRLDSREYLEYSPFWLEDYALYMAVKDHYGNIPWFLWPDEDLRSYEKDAVEAARERFCDAVGFFKFVQWLFYNQWKKILVYAGEQGISVIGDMPFYVSEDSVEVWSRRELFEADVSGSFSAVAGAPPDYFNPDGQCWGSPIYNWKRMKKDGYEWWTSRMGEAIGRYDMIRLDHFRGFESYWRVPSTSREARDGAWIRGPGLSPLRAMERAFGRLPVIAEDLGDVGEGVEDLLRRSGYRGTRVLQFGFLGDEKHLPHNFTENCIAYTGTHDNTTLLAWLFELREEDRNRALFYLGFDGDWTAGGPNCAINKAWIRLLFMSGASIVIVPVQDMLGFGSDTRTNTPGAAEGNWRFRMNSEAFSRIDRGFYKMLNDAFDRDNAPLKAGTYMANQ